MPEGLSIELPEGTLSRDAWTWVYRLGLVLLHVLLLCGWLWVNQNFVTKTEYRVDNDASAARQAIVIKQQQDILIALAGMDAKMGTNTDRDHRIEKVEDRISKLEQYEYSRH